MKKKRKNEKIKNNEKKMKKKYMENNEKKMKKKLYILMFIVFVLCRYITGKSCALRAHSWWGGVKTCMNSCLNLFILRCVPNAMLFLSFRDGVELQDRN